MSAALILTAGAFGEAVGAFVRERIAADVVPLPRDPSALEETISGASFVGLATWRPYTAHADRIDEICTSRGIRWSEAEIHGQRLTVGPLVVPGAGACYACYRKRWNVHHPAPERELVLEDAYRRDHGLGPRGFIAPLVAIAGAGLVEDASAAPEQAGRLRLVDVLTGSVLESAVIGVHGCRRCRPAEPSAPGARFVERLIPAVESILA